MSKKLIHLPNSELELMMILWDADTSLTRAQIDEQLVGKQTWGPTTVLNLLARLVDKGFVAVEQNGKGKMNYYTAIVSRDEYIRFESSTVIGRLCARSVSNLIANLYENQSIDDRELDELQEFLDSAKKGK